MIVCTAGDIFEYTPTNRTPWAETERKAKYMSQALGLMDYDAIALGEKDLAFGTDLLQGYADEYSLPFVCANAVDPDGKPLFEPYRIVERDGVKVAIMGLVSPERHIIAQVESELLGKKIRIDDPSEVALKYLPQMREAADVLVLLSHTGIETSEFLSEDLGFDVVIVGHYPAVAAAPEKVGNAIFCQAGAKSDRFGTLDLTLNDANEIEKFSGDAVRLLLKGPQNDEIHELGQELDRIEKEERREAQLASQREREKVQQEKAVATIHDRNGIFGAESCRSCHQPVYDSWLATPHATAFATLAEADAWDNPDCIGCHVTGAADKHHVMDVNIAPEIWNVQCEECHGSGLQHARDGSYLGAGEATCRKCHDPDNSPEFDYELYKSYGVH
ncbi:MAG: hypothetical protein KC591_11835 [Gemmatimonadetes bacterium]|nr:hypothetical protein [Gemmatimonadota bacterium]